MSTQATKPGKHGTLRLYRLEYREIGNHGNRWQANVWRYSFEHVREFFLESLSDDPGWELVSVEAVKAVSQ